MLQAVKVGQAGLSKEFLMVLYHLPPLIALVRSLKHVVTDILSWPSQVKKLLCALRLGGLWLHFPLKHPSLYERRLPKLKTMLHGHEIFSQDLPHGFARSRRGKELSDLGPVCEMLSSWATICHLRLPLLQYCAARGHARAGYTSRVKCVRNCTGKRVFWTQHLDHVLIDFLLDSIDATSSLFSLPRRLWLVSSHLGPSSQVCQAQVNDDLGAGLP